MLIAEINGGPAAQHPAARAFLDEGFAATAMGLQARTDRLRPRGYAGARSSTGIGGGIGIAGTDGGGTMANNPANQSMEDEPRNRPGTSDVERERIRSTNDDDQQMERNSGDDRAVRGQDVDPDSAEAEVDRNDSIDDEEI
jgi:hypothetical protein